MDSIMVPIKYKFVNADTINKEFKIWMRSACINLILREIVYIIRTRCVPRMLFEWRAGNNAHTILEHGTHHTNTHNT